MTLPLLTVANILLVDMLTIMLIVCKSVDTEHDREVAR